MRKKKRFHVRKTGTKAIVNIDKRIRKIENMAELKWNDEFPTAGQQVTNALNSILLNAPVQGDNPYNRQGAQIYMTSFQIRWHCIIYPNATTPTEVRLLVVLDKQANQSTFATTDLFDNTVVTDLTHAPFNHSNIKRFRVYYDKRFAMAPIFYNAITGTLGNAKVVTVKKKLGVKTYYNLGANAGDITDIDRGALYFCWIGTSAVSDNQPRLTVSSRVYFKDF